MGLAAAGAAVALLLALVWPDVPDRVERNLASADLTARRQAAQELRSLSPSRGAPLALRALADPDVEVRIAAAQSAVRLRAADVVELVLPWLGERDPRLRLAACEVARAMPGPRAIPQLARALGDTDPGVRGAAADALGTYRPSAREAAAEADPVAPLLGKLDDASAQVKIQVVRSLARLGDPRAVAPMVGKVQDSAPEVRREVARALGELGDKRAAQALVLALRDERGDVRVEALSALGRMRAAEATAAIAPYVQDRATATRQASLSALGRIATPEAVRVLVSAMGSTDDPAAELERTPVRDALVAASAAAVAELHAVLTGSPTRGSAASAAWVLGALGARGEARTVVAAMRRGVLPVSAALHALAGCGTEESMPVVLEFAADASAGVRAEARRAALALLDPARPDGRAVEPLAAALRDARIDTRERAELAVLLGRTGAARAAPLVASLTRSKERTVRLAALDALGSLGGAARDVAPTAANAGEKPEAAAAEEALLDAIADPDATVRLRAAVALADVAGPGALAKIVARLEVGTEVDRRALLVAAGGALTRHASEAAAGALAHALETAAGPERDAIMEALGRSRARRAAFAIADMARSDAPDDRRAAAAALAGRAFDGNATSLAIMLTRDADADTRAQAAWSLGTLAAPSDGVAIDALARLAAGPDVDVAVDATAALARIAARARDPNLASRVLCPRLDDRRAYVRANAFAGLALSRARCGDATSTRAALERDDSDAVRSAAALAIAASPRDDRDLHLLETCARADRSARVAERCRDAARTLESAQAAAPRGATGSATLAGRAPTPVAPRAPTSDAIARARAVVVYVVPAGATEPQPGAPYALELADGLVRAGSADRRGAIVEPVAPDGDLTLRRPAALAR